MICVDLMVQNNENKRIISKNDGTFKLSSEFTNLILIFAGEDFFSFLINKIVVGNLRFDTAKR